MVIFFSICWDIIRSEVATSVILSQKETRSKTTIWEDRAERLGKSCSNDTVWLWIQIYPKPDYPWILWLFVWINSVIGFEYSLSRKFLSDTDITPFFVHRFDWVGLSEEECLVCKTCAFASVRGCRPSPGGSVMIEDPLCAKHDANATSDKQKQKSSSLPSKSLCSTGCKAKLPFKTRWGKCQGSDVG